MTTKAPAWRGRRFTVLGLLAALSAATLAAAQSTSTTSTIGSELTDREFWRLVSDLSEPDGFFEDENYVSNELGYQRLMQRLQDTVAPGGVFVGVGPEQNFAYIGAVKPRMAFVLDIRRQNLVQHLMYKALFELSADRTEFLSRLFSRPAPTSLDAAVSAQALFQAYATIKPDRGLFDKNLAAIVEVLTVRHSFFLTPADRQSMQKVLDAFYQNGPEVRYVCRNTAELHPTYAQMMTAADEKGRIWSYLANNETFEYLRLMQRRNLIVPVVGDFAGPKALRAIGAYVRDRGAAINLFYASNVEPYLFASGTWKSFYDSVLTLPLAKDATVVRTFFGSTSKECAAMRPTIRTPVVGSMATLVDAYRNGMMKTQCDLVRDSK